MRIRGQRTEDRGQKFSRGCAARVRQPARSADNNPSSVFCLLSSERGFTLIELLVVISIVAIMSSVLLGRMQNYQERAEKAAMEQFAGTLQSALTLKYGRLITQHMEANAPALATENPMRWLAKPPINYAGEFYDVTPHAVAPGNWVFDLKTRNLIYLVDRSDHFTPGKDGHKWVRFHVELLYENSTGPSDREGKELVGIVFEPTEPYRWLDLE